MDECEKAGANRVVDLLSQNKQLKAENKNFREALKLLGEGVERYNSLTVVISRGNYEMARKKAAIPLRINHNKLCPV